MSCPNCKSKEYYKKTDPEFNKYPLYQCNSCLYTELETQEDYDKLMEEKKRY